MKLCLSSILLVFLFSCRKENTDLGPDYPNLLGKWENTDPSDDRVHIEFFKNGYIKISKSTERMKNFKVDNYDFSPANPDKIRYFSTKHKDNTYYDIYVTFSNSPVNNYDTIKTIIGRYSDGFTLYDNYAPTYIKVQ